MSYKITILTDKTSWMNKYSLNLKELFEKRGHIVDLISSRDDIKKGDIAFLLSCFEIIPEKYLKLNKNNIVVHASRLPEGKGWSPASWQILEGKNEIPLTLFEAVNAVDAGKIYMQDEIKLEGTELIDEWQSKLGEKIIEMCFQYVENYPVLGKEQIGESTFYPKRKPQDSRLDINKSIKEQFNLLRIVDNEKYPAYFEIAGKPFIVRIERGGGQIVTLSWVEFWQYLSKKIKLSGVCCV